MLYTTVVGRHLIVLALVVGCTGVINAPAPPGQTPQQALALQKWVKQALPVFKAKCSMCHDGSMPDIGFLAGMTDLMIRDTAIAFLPQVVNLNAPQSSRVLSKGVHEGPQLLSPEASDILEWLIAERDARPPGPVIETPQFVLMMCTAGNPGDATCPINKVDLSSLGPAGAEFDFVAQALSGDLYTTGMSFKPGTDGLYVEHPLFESWPPAATGSDAGVPAPIPDSLDRYFATKLNLMPGAAPAPLGAGNATFAGFVPTNMMSIRFDAIDKYRPGP